MLTHPLANLNRSFGAIYSLLERPRAARRVVVGLLAVHSMLLAYSAYVHSPTLNEPGHLVAGLSIWKFGRFDIYSVNPPLVKMVAVLPVIAAGYEEDWSGFYAGLGARPESRMGEDFVNANGARSFFLVAIARLACIPFSWIGGIVCYLWARDLCSRPAGVLACSIWCFEPNILAHASLITPDAHATALGLAACYTFWRWLKKPTWAQAALTGFVLGLAELAKTTLVLFYPLWPAMWLAYRWPDRVVMVQRDWLREIGMLIARMGIGLYVLNLGYGFEGSLQPLGEYQFISDLLRGQNSSADKAQNSISAYGTATREVDPLADDSRRSSTGPQCALNRFAGTWLSAVPMPFPQHYLIGIDLQQRDFEDYPRPSYLGGEWRDHGWWYYYLYAVAIKVPLGLWLLGVFTLINVLVSRSREYIQRPTARLRDFLTLLFPSACIFVVASSKTGFSEHMRYVLPSFPFVFVWISKSARNFVDNRSRKSVSCPWSLRTAPASFSAVISLALLLWSFASALWIFPHILSYFNESIGGPLSGSEHLLGSNVDWGQDFRYLKWRILDACDGRPMRLAYCGGFNPSSVGLADALPMDFRTAVGQEESGGNEISPCLQAVSVNLAHGSGQKSRDGSGMSSSLPSESVTLLSKVRPVELAGYSIYIFRLNERKMPDKP